VREEVLPLRPDLVVFYEGALRFDLSSMVANSKELKTMPRPEYEASAGRATEIAQQSSLAAHVLSALGAAGLSTGRVGEAPKPEYELVWPAGLDEKTPDIRRQDLPANLSPIVRDLDEMRSTLAAVGSEFAVSSFAWLVYDGLSVDPIQGRYIWVTNNQTYWPWRYRDIRRVVDFENRAYAEFARIHGLPFLDVAGLVPLESSLYADGVHMTQSGVRVKAWAFFRELLPIIESRLSSRQWPRANVIEHWPLFTVKRQTFDCSTDAARGASSR